MTPPHGSPAWVLRSLRAIAGLTQPQLATHLDVTPVTISRWERGHNPVPWAMLEAVAELAELEVVVTTGVGR